MDSPDVTTLIQETRPVEEMDIEVLLYGLNAARTHLTRGYTEHLPPSDYQWAANLLEALERSIETEVRNERI